ncbi:hypothetical protein LCGC14_0476500 [marine sediment metagenome]|uniref:Uncharacterized protein n=1 Tax=marine sediment metagenome TaxID=412755 RepID=A0A0F9STJ4_9ZZZZ
MGKVVTYLTILIMIDLFFIATGQICNTTVGCSLGSIILNSVIDIQNILSLSFFTEFIGQITSLFDSATGIGSLILGGTVIVGSLFIPSEQRIFIPIAFSLSLLASDFVFIGSYLISLNPVLGTFLMVPLITIYVFTVVEWVKNKD